MLICSDGNTIENHKLTYKYQRKLKLEQRKLSKMEKGSKMKVKFISTTNNLAECIVGQEVELHFEHTAGFTFNPEGLGFEYRKGEWRTSQIQNINFNETSRDCYIVTITTRNSEYVFQKGIPSDKKPLTDDEILGFQMATMF